jgi:3-oxoadipate enol-lactonase
MTDLPVIDIGEWPGFERRAIAGPAGALSVRIAGDQGAPAVLLNHSILTSSAIWRRQAASLAGTGFRVIAMDMRGHGRSEATPAPYGMDDLVADDMAVLDALGIDHVHQVGVSQGGMIGLGLGVRHPERLESLCIVAARADAPPAFAAAWNDRIALARDQGSVAALAAPTAERWFGAPFLMAQPKVADALLACIRETSAEGFVGCAQAIQGLDYLRGIGRITVPTALVIGERDTLLLQPMRDLAPQIASARLFEIEDAGHLPQVDQPEHFNAVLARHLAQFAAAPAGAST